MDDKLSIELDTVMAIHNHTIYLDGVTVSIPDGVDLIGFWSTIDPACLLLNRKDSTLVLDVQSIIFVSQEQVIVQQNTDPVSFVLEPGEFAQISAQQLTIAEMLANDTYSEEISKRVDEHFKSLEALPVEISPEVKAARERLIQAYAEDFPH